MIKNTELIKVTNRDNGMVGYSIPDLNNLNRIFSAGETKMITMEELRKLSWLPNDGGRVLLKDYLLIDNKEAVKELLSDVEPEYYYKEEDVKNLLLNGSLDELKDCLDFAPQGTIDLVKKVAVELPLNDIEKREAIKNMIHFNIDAAVMINKETKEDEEEIKKVRRTTSTEKSEDTKEETVTSKRRVQK